MQTRRLPYLASGFSRCPERAIRYLLLAEPYSAADLLNCLKRRNHMPNLFLRQVICSFSAMLAAI
jgi:hypothetical protein